MKEYSTSQAAALIGVHPNTVRFYEDMGLLPPVPRKANGYRRFTPYHIEQMKLLRIAFDSEIICGNLRKMTIEILHCSAAAQLEEAAERTEAYRCQIAWLRKNAEDTILAVQAILEHTAPAFPSNAAALRRKEAAQKLHITPDILRNWERNGLIEIPRTAEGYRLYGPREIQRLKIIRTLRDANYSMMAILRMLSHLDNDLDTDLKAVIDTPDPEEDIITATDQFITSLQRADANAGKMLEKLDFMKTLL